MNTFKSETYRDGTPTGRDSDGLDVNGHRWPVFGPQTNGAVTIACENCGGTFDLSANYFDPEDNYLKRKLVRPPKPGRCPGKAVAV